MQEQLKVAAQVIAALLRRLGYSNLELTNVELEDALPEGPGSLHFSRDSQRRILTVSICKQEPKPVLGTFSYEGKATTIHEGAAAEVAAEINKADLGCTAELTRSEPITWFGIDLVGARVRVRDSRRIWEDSVLRKLSGRMGYVEAVTKTWDCSRDMYLVNTSVRLDPIPGLDETLCCLRAEDLEILDSHKEVAREMLCEAKGDHRSFEEVFTEYIFRHTAADIDEALLLDEQNLSKAEEEWKPVESLEQLKSLHGRVLRVALKPEAASLSGRLCVLLSNSETEKHNGWALVRFLEPTDNWRGGTRCNWKHLEFCSGTPASCERSDRSREMLAKLLHEVGEAIRPDPPSMELDGVALASLANRLIGHCKRCGLTACSHPRTGRDEHER